VDFFPVFLDLRERLVLVLGEGPAATRKAALVRQAGAEVRVAKIFSPALLDGVLLAIGADTPEGDLAALSAAARARGIPVNIVDRPELCSVIMPAVVDRAPITIAISSGGAAPVLARLIRARIEEMLAPSLGRLASLAARLRKETLRHLPDLDARRRMLERAFTGSVAARFLAGDEAGAEAEYRVLLIQETGNPAGSVFFVCAPASDLLTLRAARLLGVADAVVHDAKIGTDVLELTRREAERIVAGPDVVDRLVALTRTGKQVVRVRIEAPDALSVESERNALAKAGIESIVIPFVP